MRGEAWHSFLESDPVSTGPHQERLRLPMRGLEELGSHRDHGKNKMERNLLKRCHVCGFLRVSTGFMKKRGSWEGRGGTVMGARAVMAGSVGPSCH